MLRMISSLQLATFRFCLLLNFFLTKEVCVLSSLSMLITTQRIKESSSGAFSFLTVQAFSPKLTSTSVSAAIWPGSVAAIRIARNFTPTAPNRVWTSDITYLWTDKGWLYLAIVLDLFNREVVGWSLKPRMTADIVTNALTMAWFRKRPAPGLLHHSDRGSQYASHAFQDKLKAYGMTCSMSRKGNCWDNAPTESWFNSFKNERVHGIRYATHADMKTASFEYIEVFYNRKRQHSTLSYKSPVQFLESWISEQHQEKQVA